MKSEEKNSKKEVSEIHGPESQAEAVSPLTVSKEEHENLLARFKELEDMRERLLRGAADFENAKKRLAKERDEFVKFSQENLLRELLPVLDNFERALAHAGAPKEPALKGIVAGIHMVFKQINEILKNQGLRRLKTLGETFDPHQHEAVGYSHEPGKEGEIVEEIEPGYFLHDRLIRAAKVRVRSPHAPKAPEEKQDEIT